MKKKLILVLVFIIALSTFANAEVTVLNIDEKVLSAGQGLYTYRIVLKDVSKDNATVTFCSQEPFYTAGITGGKNVITTNGAYAFYFDGILSHTGDPDVDFTKGWIQRYSSFNTYPDYDVIWANNDVFTNDSLTSVFFQGEPVPTIQSISEDTLKIMNFQPMIKTILMVSVACLALSLVALAILPTVLRKFLN